ncbi:MAG: tRNA epoxyqueuosine(34) reductase QueG [Bacillota bacterium]
MAINNELLKQMASACNIEQTGVVTTDPLTYMQPRLKRRIDEKRITPFEEKDPARRISAKHLFNSCQSIIVIALPYAAPKKDPPLRTAEPRGTVARCARSVDYHKLIEARAAKLAGLLEKNTTGNINPKIYCDRSPLLERELAFKAGLGLIGENCTLINRHYGSYITIGTILLDKKIEPEKQTPLKKHCLRCGKCQKACPTGAITEPYILNPYRCLSYLTQAKETFPRNLRSSLGKRIYGCDTCQEVCPLNQNRQSSPHPEAAFSFFPAEPLLFPLLEISQKEFKLSIELTSAGWRGKTTLQRNAVIALGNSGDQAAVPLLARFLKNDPRPVIRVHAAWSLGRLGGNKACFALDKSLINDPEAEVKKEARLALSEQDNQ